MTNGPVLVTRSRQKNRPQSQFASGPVVVVAAVRRQCWPFSTVAGVVEAVRVRARREGRR